MSGSFWKVICLGLDTMQSKHNYNVAVSAHYKAIDVFEDHNIATEITWVHKFETNQNIHSMLYMAM